ncbi:pentatricopeptide repeat-containing protein At3g02330, mitochondrial-like [Impatiens glandulifera]|uniref:pentatricopeptide repeat-containing protein At3g02330, mitochondrial-like n=1 Tax=Impatiens glandulifera TaxID=253017 RepID=UPI001FB150F7|nr:pentatricopeptide repeat-containing protein At3g02330, mitochondrial-like [Impatiens glandulifera]XP_047307625.1 pentatricopeptide repeat-containing protein At3g02330, mitochondrial-like [Impatiens glandulifera]
MFKRFLFCLSPRLHFHSFRHIRSVTTVAAEGKRTFSHIFQQCSERAAIFPGKQAHARMVLTHFTPTVFVTNCLMQMYIKCSTLDYARKVFDRMPDRDMISWNAMIFGYVGSRNLEVAHSMFDLMPVKDVVSWNTLISGYSQIGKYRKSLEMFLLMMQMESLVLDRATFAIVLKACSSSDNYEMGIQVHALAVFMGFDCDVVTGSALIDMYAKCRKLEESLKFFDEMPERNLVSWSAAIAGCIQNEQLYGGLELFKKMQRDGVGVSQSAYASVFRSCAALCEVGFGSQLHAHALKTNFGSDMLVGTSILDMYAKSGRLSDARKLFNSLRNHSVQSYNAMIVGCVRSSQGFDALQIFKRLLQCGLPFDEITLSGAVSACSLIQGRLQGIQIHGLALKSSLWSQVCVANAVLDMYGKCGDSFIARRVFDEMPIRDAVSWNAVIAAYVQNGEEDETLSIFVLMLRSRMEPDDFTYGSVLKACSSQQSLNKGLEIHTRIVKSGMGFDWFVGSSLVDMYCKCAKIDEAEKIHYRLEERTIISWNAIISGFSLHNQSEESQKFFFKMLKEQAEPDIYTYTTVLDTCSNLATVELGKQIHAQITKHNLQQDVFISSTLVDMYSKCGILDDSKLIFERSLKRDIVTWNAMITAYAHHGLADEALRTFDRLQHEGLKPIHATIVAILRACAHMGLVEKGVNYFNSMKKEYGLDPQLEHYTCLVDIFGRSGQIRKALEVIQEMPYEADDVTWKTLLNLCKLKGNVEIAEIAAKAIMKMDNEDSAALIQLSNVYADAGMWDEVKEVRKMMRSGRLKKEPGCSWIEVKNELHMFLVADKAHPRGQEIYQQLHLLMVEMTWFEDILMD